MRRLPLLFLLAAAGFLPLGSTRAENRKPNVVLILSDDQGWPDYAPRSKGSPFEMGIRTPIMISWPGHMEPARSSALASSLDLMPTILAATGIAAPEGLPGIDLRDEGARRGRKAIFGTTHSIHNMNPGDPDATLQYQWCIEGRWKLLLRRHGLDTTRYKTVHDWDQVPVRLYDLEADPEETRNLAESPDQAERVARLRALIAKNLGTPGSPR